jgi:imidazole glycerol-phosphate synthase subunit HisF
LLTKRIIACLDVDAGRVVKGQQFVNIIDAGDPAELARRHAASGADEIVVLDITASHERRNTLLETVRAVAKQLFVPLTVGGGINSLETAANVFGAGADKVTMNTAALDNPKLIEQIAASFGSQAILVAIDARRGSASPGQADVYVKGGRVNTGRKVLEWACEAEAHGAGEILLTSMDRDGTGIGFDCELTAAVAGVVSIPVIASGGAGNAPHFADVFAAGRADAALAASIFHFGLKDLVELKRYLQSEGVPVRLQC